MSFETTLKIFDAAVALVPDLERKGKTVPYVGANERMFGLVSKVGEMGIRLSKEDRKLFIAEYLDCDVFKSHGAVMREYVLIPEEMYTDLPKLASYIQKGWDYTVSLPPKTAKK